MRIAKKASRKVQTGKDGEPTEHRTRYEQQKAGICKRWLVKRWPSVQTAMQAAKSGREVQIAKDGRYRCSRRYKRPRKASATDADGPQVAGMGIMTCGKQIAKSGLSGNRNRCGTAKATAGCRSADLEKPPIAISKKRFCAPSIWSVSLGNPKSTSKKAAGRRPCRFFVLFTSLPAAQAAPKAPQIARPRAGRSAWARAPG